MQDVGRGGGVVGRGVDAGVEEGFYVAHAQEGGGGGGEQDDGVGATAGFFGEGDEGGVGGNGGGGGGGGVVGAAVAAEEDLGGFADVGELLGRVSLEMVEGCGGRTGCWFDATQYAVPVPHSPFPVVDLL